MVLESVGVAHHCSRTESARDDDSTLLSNEELIEALQARKPEHKRQPDRAGCNKDREEHQANVRHCVHPIRDLSNCSQHLIPQEGCCACVRLRVHAGR